MFETATFESMGTIHTRSRNWMLATFGFNAAILATLIAIPLLHPAMLPQIFSRIPLAAPPLVEEQPKPIVQQPQSAAVASSSAIYEDTIVAPRLIPPHPWTSGTRDDDPGLGNLTTLGSSIAPSGAGCDPFNCSHTQSHVQLAPATRKLVSTGVMEGLLVNRVVPVYPTMARVMRVSGIVQLQAMISRSGTIENLRVVSGPPLLQQAAVDAVKQWLYKPYLLNGEPVEVETSVNVDFTLN